MDKLIPADFAADADFLGDHSRRVFIKGLGYVGASLVLATLGGCERLNEQIRNRPVRRMLRTGSAEVDADINTYRQAVQAMKALAPSNGRSWVAQATIHGTPSGFNQCEHGTNHFFDWHRAYLRFFEMICQNLTGNDRFALPYWNWNQSPAIHPAFLDSASTLFAPRTRTTMAGFTSISSGQLDIIFNDTNFFTFSDQIEGTPHNSVHSRIDGTLGQFNSPLDPLFWMHHCMVDYCWYKWNVEMGRNNTDDAAWTNKVNGNFVDGAGNPATATAAVTVLMPLLAYRYESSAIGSHPASTTSIRTQDEFRTLEARLRAGANVRFNVSQRVRLAEQASIAPDRPASFRAPGSTDSFRQIVESQTGPTRLFVTVDAPLPPTTDFFVRVYVNLPSANASTPMSDPHYAGSFAFFGQPAPDAAGQAPAHRHQPRFLVNVTETLQRLRAAGALSPNEPLSIQLVPTPYDPGTRVTAPLALNAVDLIATPVIVTTEPAR